VNAGRVNEKSIEKDENIYQNNPEIKMKSEDGN